MSEPRFRLELSRPEILALLQPEDAQASEATRLYRLSAKDRLETAFQGRRNKAVRDAAATVRSWPVGLQRANRRYKQGGAPE